jgi:ABC-type transport system involved in cytochrome bd biosynthesis fused ATPase/permease subunit
LATLLTALSTGSVAAATGLALFVGAPYLLAYSASHSSLAAGSTLAVLLIVIELLAFLRSPLRFVERMSAHDLGLRSVTQWRRWLVVTIGSWNYARWRAAASGDLLERAMADTDALQDLWLRCLVPLVTTAVAFLGADISVALLSSPRLSSLQIALTLGACQLGAIALLALQLPRLVRVEREVRHARATRTALRLELQSAAPELELLGHRAFLEHRLAVHNEHVAHLEHRRQRRWRWARAATVIAPLITIALTVAASGGAHNLAGRGGLVMVLISLGVSELVSVAVQALRVGVSVTASAERLDELSFDTPARTHSWPEHAMIDVESLCWAHGDQEVLRDVTFTVAPGRRIAVTGTTGSGKSTLLRLLARLDEVPHGAITVGGVDVGDIEEIALRRHVGYVSAEPGLLDGNVDAVVRAGRVSSDDVVTSLARVGINVHETQRLDHLSRGEAQRVALVRGLLDEPSVVLLDEPTAGLGDMERALVLERLSACFATVIVATHDEHVVAWCDDHYELREGSLVLINRSKSPSPTRSTDLR